MAVPGRRRDEPASHARAAYDRDLYNWALEQGALLRARRFDEVDIENVAEEIESLARTEFDKLVSFLRLTIMHMLKWEYQPSRRTRSWAISIANHRESADEILADNPGLKSRIGEALERAYPKARRDAADETELPFATFPESCPYSLSEIMTRPHPFE